MRFASQGPTKGWHVRCLIALQVELACRVAVLLVRLHHSQLIATAAARPIMIKLQGLLRSSIQVIYLLRSAC